MKISRVWEMPHKWTFRMKCVQELLIRYGVGKGWIDPFSGESIIAEHRNDVEGRNAVHKEDGLEFLKAFDDGDCVGGLFDPPYSIEQCLRKYTPIQKGTAGRAEYWAKCKNELGRVIREDGMSICFGWDSTGLGKKRGFKIIEILLICHGACHNDTIVTVERKERG